MFSTDRLMKVLLESKIKQIQSLKLQRIENTPMLFADTSKQPILSDVCASERGPEQFDRQNLKFQVELIILSRTSFIITISGAYAAFLAEGGGGGEGAL